MDEYRIVSDVSISRWCIHSRKYDKWLCKHDDTFVGSSGCEKVDTWGAWYDSKAEATSFANKYFKQFFDPRRQRQPRKRKDKLCHRN